MLIQSWGGAIRVFPAMPSTWKDANFYSLRTEGAFLVSAVRKNGDTKFIHVKSLAGAPCIVKTDLKGMVKLIGPSSANMKQKDGQIELTLKKGEEAVIYTGEQPPSLEITNLPVMSDKINSWGVRKKGL
jgi:hypothetical protein